MSDLHLDALLNGELIAMHHGRYFRLAKFSTHARAWAVRRAILEAFA